METDRALRYWRERLAGFTSPTRLGVERVDASPEEAGGHVTAPRRHVRAHWPTERVADLERAASAAGVRVEHVVYAAWALVFAAHAGESDIVCGVSPPTDDATWPLRLTARSGRGLGAYLRHVGDLCERDEAHLALSSAEIASCTELQDGTALFSTAVRCSREPGTAGRGSLGIEVAVTLGEAPGATIDYADGTLTATDAARLLGHLDRALGAMATADAGTAVGELGPLSAQERAQLVEEWNATDRHLGEPACLHELFEQRAARTPHAVAVVAGDTRLTYAEVADASARVAAGLVAAGVGRGDTVALTLRRGAHMVTALLGVLRAGAAYAPVGPELPSERAGGLLAQLAAPVVLADESTLPEVLRRIGELPALREIRLLGDPWGEALDITLSAATAAAAAAAGVRVTSAFAAPHCAALPRVHPDDPAYTIFTSGSTGSPKGVTTAHAPAVNLVRWVNDTYGVGPKDRVLFLTSLGFDLSVYDVFGLLAAGGSIRVASEEEVRDPRRLLAVLDSEPITYWDSAPAALQQLEPFLAQREPAADRPLRLVFLSGDWVPLTLPDAVRTGFPGCEVVALGGATEATVWSNHFPVEKVDESWTSVPYGRPIANARYYILDADLRPAPIGAPGDLYIGGSCLAVGYHAAARLTAAEFVPDPFGGASGGRLYHTGDRARFWADGTIEFLGRRDHQVKIRGFRVELGEVESCLAAEAGVASAVAAVHETPGGPRLAAYAVPHPGRVLDPDALREALAARLPSYMVPADVTVLDALPVTANGKLNRAALPVPVPGTGGSGYVPPRGPVQELLAALWAETLGVERVGADDDFFALGGHSLLMTQVMALLKRDLQVEVAPLAMLNNPTLTGFAALVERALLAQSQAAEENTAEGTEGDRAGHSI